MGVLGILTTVVSARSLCDIKLKEILLKKGCRIKKHRENISIIKAMFTTIRLARDAKSAYWNF